LAGVERQQVRLDRVLGEVREQLLFGSNDEVLVRAYLSDYQGPPGEKLPHQLRLTFPQTDTVLTLTLGRIEVNPTMSGNLWQPPSGGTAQMVDLRDLQRWSEQQRAGRGRIAGVSQEGGEFESAMLEGELPAVGAVTPLGEGRGVVGGATSDISAVPDFDVPRRRRWYWPWQR